MYVSVSTNTKPLSNNRVSQSVNQSLSLSIYLSISIYALLLSLSIVAPPLHTFFVQRCSSLVSIESETYAVAYLLKIHNTTVSLYNSRRYIYYTRQIILLHGSWRSTARDGNVKKAQQKATDSTIINWINNEDERNSVIVDE